MHIVITGGAGFIGSHLAQAYLEEGRTVSVIDNLSTGSLRNIRNLAERFPYRFSLHVEDIRNLDVVRRLIRKSDLVFHLAAVVGVRRVIENPLEAIRVNVRGTETVLETCNEFRRRVVVVSSSEVYGKQNKAPLFETDDTVLGCSAKLRWSYAATKLIGEFTALTLYRAKGLETVVLRLFNTIGPRQTGEYGMVVPRFINRALRNKPLLVYGDGKQSRTFTNVSDAVQALKTVAVEPACVGEVLNVGGEEEISIEALAETVIDLTQSRSEIRFVPYEEAFTSDFEDMLRRVPSIEKIQRLTGYHPKFGLHETLHQIIDYTSKHV